MNSIKRNKRLLIILLIMMPAIAVGVWIAHDRSNKASTKPTEPSGVGYVVVNNTEPLSNILLNTQETVVESALSDYVKSNVGSGVQSVSLVGKPTLNSGGIITITVAVSGTSKQFQASIDRIKYFDKIIFSVPADNYQIIIPVYTSNSDS